MQPKRIHKDIVDAQSIKKPEIIPVHIKSPPELMRVKLMVQDVRITGIWLDCFVVYPEGDIPTVQGLKEIIHANFPDFYPSIESVHITRSDTRTIPDDSSLQQNNTTICVVLLSTAPAMAANHSPTPP